MCLILFSGVGGGDNRFSQSCRTKRDPYQCLNAIQINVHVMHRIINAIICTVVLISGYSFLGLSCVFRAFFFFFLTLFIQTSSVVSTRQMPSE